MRIPSGRGDLVAKYTTDQIRPMAGWALCRSLIAVNKTRSGLVMVRPSADMETGKTTECVAKVLRVTPAIRDDGSEVDPLFKVGDRISASWLTPEPLPGQEAGEDILI